MGRDSCGPKTAPRAKTECRIDLRELERERGTETETEREESSWISSRWCHSAPAALALDAGLQPVHGALRSAWLLENTAQGQLSLKPKEHAAAAQLSAILRKLPSESCTA